MSIRERLKLAYENVAYGADKTWSKETNSLQKSNLELFLTESQLQETKPIELRPRTVRDCIPQSKLAKYSNYEYNDSRELSYTIEEFKISHDSCHEFIEDQDKEPWMLAEVDNYYKFYTDHYKHVLNSKLKEDLKKTTVRTIFESPFLKSNSLPEYFLKHQIIKEDVKKLWDTSNQKSKSFMFRSHQFIRGEKSLVVYKSPAGQVFVSESDDVTSELKEDYYEWCKDDYDFQNSVDHLNLLSTSFKEQIKNDGVTSDHILNSQSDSVQNRRLYSAVLQGYNSKTMAHEPTEGQMTILKRNIAKPDEHLLEKLGSISDFNNQNSLKHSGKSSSNKSTLRPENVPKLFPKSLFANSRSVQTSSTSSDVGVNNSLPSTNQKFPCEHSHHDSTTLQNNFSPTISHQTRYRPNYVSSGYHYPSFYMFIQNSFQQNYLPSFYTPMMLQRSSPISFERNFPQRTYQVPISSHYNVIPASSFVAQNKLNPIVQRFEKQLVKSKAKEKPDNVETNTVHPGLGVSGNIRKTNDDLSCSGLTSQSELSVGEANYNIEDLVTRTIDLVLDESKTENIVPVSGSQSDELERQALEQYNNSSDNVFHELERQAAEEYEFCSENYNSPPNLDLLFGGFLNGYKFCFI